jgi:ubiquitin carboxyl-terminal hydrolase 34
MPKLRPLSVPGHPHDVTVFTAVKSWLDICTNNLGQICYETFLDDREFWEELPTVVEGLLRRVYEGLEYKNRLL